MSKWRVWMQSDLLRGKWLEECRTFLTHELFYILAKKDNISYIHFRSFMDDWDGANALLQRILACEDFTPEGKPTIWTPAKDIQPYRWRTKLDWRRLLFRKLEEEKWRSQRKSSGTSPSKDSSPSTSPP